MPNIIMRHTRHVLILHGRNAAANLVTRWLRNRMVLQNFVRTFHATSTRQKFSTTRSLHDRDFFKSFFARMTFTNPRSLRGRKILCQTYAAANFRLHYITKGEVICT